MRSLDEVFPALERSAFRRRFRLGVRERDYLRRQVKSLSAEGRFSAYILLALPPLILLYEMMTNRDYIRPLYTTGMGWVMLAGMGLMMGIGAFMMSRMVKLEV